MNIEVTTIYNDGYIGAKVIDGDNYLSYLYRPIEGWTAVHGKVDNRTFKKDTMNLIWKTKGRGRASENTIDKLYTMQKFFMAKIPDSESIRKGNTDTVIFES